MDESAQKPKVIIVDDDRDTREMLTLALELEGFEVSQAANGLRLISAMHVDRPDVILLDVMMSWIDGFELCRAIKKNDLFQDIPVVFISARKSTEDERAGLEAGAIDYFTKPLDMDQLIARLRENPRRARRHRGPRLMAPPLSAGDQLAAVARRVDAALAGLARELEAAAAEGGPARLHQAISYALAGGGKRLRPALVLAACEALGGDTGESSLAMRFAVSLELVHGYSLVHDDLPCMDDDDLRRGRPTLHRAFDEAAAVLVGDGLQTLAFRHLLSGPEPRAARLAALLAEAAFRMVEGQALDLAAEHRALSESEILELMARKTGALLAAAVDGGALAATGEGDALSGVGARVGLAFQIVDDLLDLTGDPAVLGKAVRKDATAGKATLPALLGAEEARRRAEEACDGALATLMKLGPRAEALRALVRYVVTRAR